MKSVGVLFSFLSIGSNPLRTPAAEKGLTIERKLVEKFNFPRRDADQVGAFLRRVSIVVEPADLPPDLCRDPTDLPVLGTAVAGACALLVSVDRDLLDMQTIQTIPIIRPGEYWRRIAEID